MFPTPVTSINDSAGIPGKPLRPPRLLIPPKGKRLPTPAITPEVSTSKLVENTGRWSEEEHDLFLQGLETHGKQWKLIASMIGSRTVVQVRTHAQKYFQKMNRNPKRKSLPAIPPRKKQRKSPGLSRSVSLSLSTIATSDEEEEEVELPIMELPNIASQVSVSSVAESYESPIGVEAVDLLQTWDASESLYLEEAIIPQEDPLEWLLQQGGEYLPESSLEDVDDDLTANLQIVDPSVTVQSLL